MSCSYVLRWKWNGCERKQENFFLHKLRTKFGYGKVKTLNMSLCFEVGSRTCCYRLYIRMQILGHLTFSGHKESADIDLFPSTIHVTHSRILCTLNIIFQIIFEEVKSSSVKISIQSAFFFCQDTPFIFLFVIQKGMDNHSRSVWMFLTTNMITQKMIPTSTLIIENFVLFESFVKMMSKVELLLKWNKLKSSQF